MIPVFFFAVVLAQPAYAAEVAIPYGDWIAALLDEHLYQVLIATMLWLLRKLPKSVYEVIQTMRVDQLLERAINYGFNAVKGATKDRVLTVEIGSEVVAESVAYALEHAPTVVRWLGGTEKLKQKILARLALVPEATAADVLG
jgi:hypothetical protein